MLFYYRTLWGLSHIWSHYQLSILGTTVFSSCMLARVKSLSSRYHCTLQMWRTPSPLHPPVGSGGGRCSHLVKLTGMRISLLRCKTPSCMSTDVLIVMEIRCICVNLFVVCVSVEQLLGVYFWVHKYVTKPVWAVYIVHMVCRFFMVMKCLVMCIFYC